MVKNLELSLFVDIKFYLIHSVYVYVYIYIIQITLYLLVVVDKTNTSRPQIILIRIFEIDFENTN